VCRSDEPPKNISMSGPPTSGSATALAWANSSAETSGYVAAMRRAFARRRASMPAASDGRDLLKERLQAGRQVLEALGSRQGRQELAGMQRHGRRRRPAARGLGVHGRPSSAATATWFSSARAAATSGTARSGPCAARGEPPVPGAGTSSDLARPPDVIHTRSSASAAGVEPSFRPAASSSARSKSQ